MALLMCKDCGRQVSTRARFCPHCGRPWPACSFGPAILAGVVVDLVVASAIAFFAMSKCRKLDSRCFDGVRTEQQAPAR